MIEEVPVARQPRQEEEGEVDGEGEGDAEQCSLGDCLGGLSKIARQVGAGHDAGDLRKISASVQQHKQVRVLVEWLKQTILV